MLKRIILCVILAAILIAGEHIDAQGMGSKPDVNSLKNSPVPKTDAEKKILDVLDDMYRNQRRGMMNVSPEDGRLLR